MKDKWVDRFNHITGKAPAKDLQGVLKQIEDQCTYLLEEVKETMKAAQEGDIVECVDGVADIRYVASYLPTLLESLGVNFNDAFSEVCYNNSLKYTTSYVKACGWESYHTDLGKDVYISHVKYEDENYFTVCDSKTNKTLKYENFPKVDLTPFIPRELISAY